jgi:hypothetical protein
MSNRNPKNNAGNVSTTNNGNVSTTNPPGPNKAGNNAGNNAGETAGENAGNGNVSTTNPPGPNKAGNNAGKKAGNVNDMREIETLFAKISQDMDQAANNTITKELIGNGWVPEDDVINYRADIQKQLQNLQNSIKPSNLKLNNKNLTRAAIFDLLQTVRDELVKKKSNAEKNKIEAMRIEEERKAKESANKNAKKKSAKNINQALVNLTGLLAKAVKGMSST